jgi:A/G-specific adenine glycosylase
MARISSATTRPAKAKKPTPRSRLQHASDLKHAQPLVPPDRARELRGALLPWYESVRRDLPWRRTKDPYAVWLSEIMLQQTRVETVIPYFERFVRELPTVSALAEAPSDRVMSLWSGLGYYRRARMLHEAAMQISTKRGGVFPATAEGLAEIRGIGRYTAGAIASIAFGEQAALVDGNVVRVLARIFAIEDDVRGGPGLKKIWALAEALVPAANAGDWNQALMELGATTCIPRAPRCLVCPVRGVCAARAKGIEAELPHLLAKTKPIESRRVAVVATRKGSVVLCRRRAGGLFGGLWEPPLADDTGADADAAAAFKALVGLSVDGATPVGTVTHVLSHRRLEARVLKVELKGSRGLRGPLESDATYDAARLVPASDFATIGMSTFARKVLALAGFRPAKSQRI